MLPNYYVCSSCNEKFTFRLTKACYYIGHEPLGIKVEDKDVLSVPIRPAWCKDCECVTVVEDIATLRVFEDAYGAVRSGRAVNYPVETEFMDSTMAIDLVRTSLRWRMGRRHIPRALCCGGSSYQLLDVAQPLLKHAECEFGFINGMASIASFNGSGLGTHSPANIRLYNSEGVLIGLLTWRKQGESKWDVEGLSYPPATVE